MALAFAEIEAATKDATNPHFKNKYAGLPQVIEAIKPALVNHGLFFTQRCHPAEDGVSVETVLHHSGGEMLSLGILYLPANKRDAQGFGSALTYARRYALMTAFGVPAEDDDGNAAAKSNPSAGEERPIKRSDERPFTLGPAKNRTSLKELGRAFWRDVEACGDTDELEALVASSKPLIDQLKIELPMWWDGGTKDGGEPFEGLRDVIDRRLSDFANLANTRTVIDAG
jgi:hypothetical protein